MKKNVFNFNIKCVFIVLVMAVFAIGEMSFVLAQGRVREIRIGDGKGDWGYPNPYRHYPRGPGYVRMSWVFDTLVWKDKDGYVPALATSWQYDPGSRSFVFKLREGIQWHDGKPFGAEDVAFTVNYFIKHPYAWVPMEAVAGAEVNGPNRVTIKLKKPYAPFLAYVGGTMPVIPKHIWENVDDPKRYSDPGAFVGTGPFRFIDFDKAKGTYLYEANKDYYLGRPKVDRLIYLKTGKPLMALLSGKADLVNIRPDMAEILQKKGMVVIENQKGWNKKLMINHRKPPFNDKRFRKALAHAISQQEIIDKAHRGFGSPASFGLLSVDHELYNPNTPSYAHDPVKAREILESMGFQKNGKGFYQEDGRPLEVELLSSNITVAGESVSDRDGEVIKKELEKAGIRVRLINMEQATTDARIRNWDFDLAISGHGGLLGDARILNMMISPKAKGSVNSARYGANKELLDLLNVQVAEMDPEKRKKLVWKIQEIYADELPAISLYYPTSMSAYTPGKGVVWYYTKGGLALGIPIPQNKMTLVD
ncbi:MAG: peptide-binding protein [Deltaproteobacteria bacterium]|nr:peptide-binding protein [Deltaproteobacteria bacterium]